MAPISMGSMVPLAAQRDELRLVTSACAGLGLELESAAVLDCGGGTGRLAVPLAQLGARVTVVDISVDALAALARRAAEAGVADRVTAVQGDVEALANALDGAAFDAAVVHGVLDAVDPRAALGGVRAALRPGGVASVLVANPAAGVLAKVLSGELEAALVELRAVRAGGRFDAAALTQLCLDVGFSVERVRGVGVFADLLRHAAPGGPNDPPHTESGFADQLEELGCDQSPFREIASRLHVVARSAPAPD